MVALAPIPMTEARDGLGRRIARITFPDLPTYCSRTDYYYSTAWQVLEERDEAQPQDPDVPTEDVRYQYVWDPRYIDALVCRDEDKNADEDCTDAATGVQGSNTGDEHLYYTQDANFNVTALVDGYDGAVVQRYLYEPYGQASVRNGVRDAAGADTSESEWAERASNLFENDILFCGYRLLDIYSAVYDVRNRMYHPTLGRWLQRDPIGYADGMGLYEYVRSVPCDRLDAAGLESEVIRDAQGRGVGRRWCQDTNCLGYAMQEDAAIEPRGTHGSLANLLGARGWRCRRLVEFEECYCQENEMRMVVVIYSYPGMDRTTGEVDPQRAPQAPGGVPDPFLDPWPTPSFYPGRERPDVHAYRGPDGNAPGPWSDQPGGYQPKSSARPPRENKVPEKEVYGLQEGDPRQMGSNRKLPRHCCCKCKY